MGRIIADKSLASGWLGPSVVVFFCGCTTTSRVGPQLFWFASQPDETLAAAAEMGGKCPHRKVKKRRLSHKTARRGKFLLKADDAVYDELVKLADEGKDAQGKELPVDEDLPGMGQFYCLHCDRYFANESVKDDHYRSKRHKKRVKLMSGPAPHTQLDADLAAGMGMPDNGLKLMSM